MKAAKHTFGNNSLMYDPSVTATSVPSAIDSSTHVSPPVIDTCSYSHVFPHVINTSLNVDGMGVGFAMGATEVR